MMFPLKELSLYLKNVSLSVTLSANQWWNNNPPWMFQENLLKILPFGQELMNAMTGFGNCSSSSTSNL